MSSQNDKQYVQWRSKSDEAKKIVEQFNIFKSTNGAAGFDPKLILPREIKEKVYTSTVYLQKFNPDYFAKHYKRLARAWENNEFLTNRRIGE